MFIFRLMTKKCHTDVVLKFCFINQMVHHKGCFKDVKASYFIDFPGQPEGNLSDASDKTKRLTELLQEIVKISHLKGTDCTFLQFPNLINGQQSCNVVLQLKS